MLLDLVRFNMYTGFPDQNQIHDGITGKALCDQADEFAKIPLLGGYPLPTKIKILSSPPYRRCDWHWRTWETSLIALRVHALGARPSGALLARYLPISHHAVVLVLK